MDKPEWYGDRGDRRWRSYKKWIRRLKVDWNEHGWQWSPRPQFGWVGSEWKILGWQSDLCGCFDLRNKQALRFKDTPNGCGCMSCANPRRAYDGRSSSALTFAEQRAFLDDREDWSKRKRREGGKLTKVTCFGCGRQIGKIWLKTGIDREYLFRKVKEMGWDRRCTSCRKKLHDRLEAEKNAK
jgi:hypothetical protein